MLFHRHPLNDHIPHSERNSNSGNPATIIASAYYEKESKYRQEKQPEPIECRTPDEGSDLTEQYTNTRALLKKNIVNPSLEPFCREKKRPFYSKKSKAVTKELANGVRANIPPSPSTRHISLTPVLVNKVMVSLEDVN
ncbi:hypothetical protein Tco_1419195 [Tanacetum coccineum]